MLFALREYDEAARSVSGEAIDHLARASSPLLTMIPRSPVAHVRPTRVSAGAGVPLRQEPIAVRAALDMYIRPIVAGDLGEVASALFEVAEQQAKTLVAGMLTRVGEVTDAVGTMVRANGRGLNHELVLELLETMEIDFDADGQPVFTFVAHPETARQLRDLPEMTAEQQRAFDELMARKREEFQGRQRQRRTE